MLNKAQLIGRLTADPTMRYMPSGDPIATMTVATSRRWKDKSTGEKKEESEFHRVTFFGSLAKVAGDYLKKGSLVYIEGRIKTDSYEKNGEKRYSTGIVVEAMQMLGSKGDGQQAQRSEPEQASAQNDEWDDDGIPF